MMNFNGKIDAVYNELNSKFETLNTHVKKLETQVVQTRDVIGHGFYQLLAMVYRCF